MEVIAESLRVSQRSHLFNWLQGGFQYLIGHEVMIFGVKSVDSEFYQYEYFASTRYFSDEKFSLAIDRTNGHVSQTVKIWSKSALPYIVSNQETPASYKNYIVANGDAEQLKQAELKNYVVHGFGDNNSKISSVVILARLHQQPHAIQANMLELLMPHLHCALVKVTSSTQTYVVNQSNATKIITRREAEILQWLHMGKTNWEISSILGISPLTVKNHVQNLLRKLDVQNRSQAVVKAAKFGLIRVVK
jgi:transcriptional regulator EpsA